MLQRRSEDILPVTANQLGQSRGSNHGDRRQADEE